MQLSIKPDDEAHDPRDEIYRKVVDSLPDEARTTDVVQSLAMVLSAILIEQTKDRETCVKAAKLLCDKIMEACKTVSAHKHSSSSTDDTWKTRH